MTSTSNKGTSSGGGGGGNNKQFHTYENVGFDADQQAHSLAAAAAASAANSNGGGLQSPMMSAANGLIVNNGGGPFAATVALNKAAALESPFAKPPILHSDSAPNITPNPVQAAIQTAKILSTATDSTGVTRTLASAGASPISAPAAPCVAASAINDASVIPAAAGHSPIIAGAPSSSASASSSSSAHRIPQQLAGHHHHHNHHHNQHQHQNLVTKLITFPAQSPMDSLKEWSVSTFKCTKQLINERRGICPVTNDSQLQNDIELLRENRLKLLQMLRYGQQMVSHYNQLVRTQKQLYALMNEMSIKCITATNGSSSYNNNNNDNHNHNHNHNHNQNNHNAAGGGKPSSKQVVANFSSLGNNLSSSTTAGAAAGLHHHHHHQHHQPPPTVTATSNSSAAELHSFEDFLPVLNHMKSSSNLNLVNDFKKNAITLGAAIKNGEKLLVALNFYCSNLSTLINKTIEDTLATVKQYESARLEYDAEKNSLNLIAPTVQTSMTYSSEKLEWTRMRYEQLKEDVQIKMRLLEENTTKVMHKQLLIFNGAFASYTSGNTAALDATLKQFSIRDVGSS